MARILGYIAASLDGFIATDDDKLDWLFQYDGMELGEYNYKSFLGRVRTLVMGRGTYDFLANDPTPWGYADHRVLVVTSSPVERPKGNLEVRSDVDTLIAELRALDDGDVWMMGGGQLQMAFLEKGALDEIEIYVIPELLGGGRPLFPATGHRASPTLIDARPLDRGCVRLHYRFDRSG